MIDKSKLAKTFKSGDLRAYGAQLLEYYKQCAGSNPSGICTDKFLEKHVVENAGFTVKKALKIAKARSKNYTEDFTSTIISKKGIKKICQMLTRSGRLQGHVLGGAKRNYMLAPVDVIVIEVRANDGPPTYVPRTIKVTLGLDEEGYIYHYETPKWKKKKRLKKEKDEKE